MAILTVENIYKNYNGVRALKDVSFSVPEKTVFGILGPNGSGKTTLLGIVMDVLKATSGSYHWNGQPGSHLQRKTIGTLLETPNFYPYLSAEDNLKIAARIKGRGLDDIDNVLKAVNLYERRKSKFSSYSLGMKQRLAIASSLLGDPDILVFDEPTNGLDPAGIAEIRILIKQLSQNGKTIIMASHILDEVEKVCNHVAIIQKGELKMVGTVKDVLSNSGSGTSAEVASNTVTMELAANDLLALQKLLEGVNGIQSINISENELVCLCNEKIDAAAVNRMCFDNGVLLSKINVKRKTLEARFLEITGNQSDR